MCHECKSDSLSYACLVDMEVTTCPTEADVIVVTSVLPKSMKQKKVLWGAMLVGAYLVNPTFTLGSCKAGVAKYNGAVRFLALGDGVRTFPRAAPCIDGVVGGCLYTA